MLTARRTRIVLYFISAMFIPTASLAQPTNFIHIQSEGNEPYYVQMNGSVYNSSAIGYLVIPRVTAGDHTLVVGFPGNASSEYAFSCPMADRPRGFSLKQSIDNSWSLFDMVNFTVTRGTMASKEQLIATSSTPVEPGLHQPPVQNTSPVDPVIRNNKPTVTSSIRKIFDKGTSGGVDQVYIVLNGAKADTVALFIPILEEQEKPKKSVSVIYPSPVHPKGDRSRLIVFASRISRQTRFSN